MDVLSWLYALLNLFVIGCVAALIVKLAIQSIKEKRFWRDLKMIIEIIIVFILGTWVVVKLFYDK